MAVGRDTTVFTVALVMLIIATVFTIMRLISKWGVLKKTSADDFLVLLAWGFTVAMTVSVMVATRVGLGKLDVDMQSAWREPLKRCIYAFTIFYNPALMCLKSAILLLYLRMSTAHPFLRIASFTVLGIINVSGIVLTFLNIFQCRPVSAAFSSKDGTCIDIVSLYLASAPITFLTDLAILLLPLPILTGLRMEFRQKVVLVATFFVGGFSTIVDIIRLVYLQNALQYERAYELGSTITAKNTPPNFLYEASFTLMWSCVEVTTGLVCACVLVLKPLVLRVLPSMIHRSSEGQRTIQGAGGRVEGPVRAPRSPTNRLAPVFEVSTLQMDGADEDEIGGLAGMDFMQMLATSEPSSGQTINTNQPGTLNTPLDRSITQKSRISRHLSTKRLTKSNLFAHTHTETDIQQHPTRTFFDFVNMESKKPLTGLTEREAWWPVLFVSTVFFVWGFAYGLLGTLNGQIQSLLDYSESRHIALQSAYWLGYLLGPACIGYWTLSRSSFKSTFIAGLCLYACGAMSFWPSSVLLSYPGFFISNFIITLGLSCLEVAANPYIALAGPQHLSESRLLFSQGIQAIGSVISPILAKEALFSSLHGIEGSDLFNVQWCYLAVTLLVVVLAVIFYYVPLPESTDEELEAVASETLLEIGLRSDSTLPVPFSRGRRVLARNVLMGMGVFGIFTFVGAQETFSFHFGSVLSAIRPQADPFWQVIIGHALFALSRFLASFVTFLGILRPRIVLLISVMGSFIVTLLSLVLPAGKGTLGIMLLTFFFEAPVFPIVFATTLRNQGKNTKRTSALLVMGITGAIPFPSIAFGAEKLHRDNRRFSLVITVVTWALQFLVPIWLSGGMRTWVDPKIPSKLTANPNHSPGLKGVKGLVGWFQYDNAWQNGLEVTEMEERRGSDETPTTSVTAIASRTTQSEGKGDLFTTQRVEHLPSIS